MRFKWAVLGVAVLAMSASNDGCVTSDPAMNTSAAFETISSELTAPGVPGSYIAVLRHKTTGECFIIVADGGIVHAACPTGENSAR